LVLGALKFKGERARGAPRRGAAGGGDREGGFL